MISCAMSACYHALRGEPETAMREVESIPIEYAVLASVPVIHDSVISNPESVLGFYFGSWVTGLS